MNSYNTDVFFSNYYNLLSVHFELMQLHDDGEWHPVAYASRAVSPTEQRYAQIEKEALGITWASEQFADYLNGLKFHIETNHKPLVPLLSSRNLDNLPTRV